MGDHDWAGHEKKTFGALERDKAERWLFRDLVSTLRIEKLVVVDESNAHVGMTPSYARAPRGQRAYASMRRMSRARKNVTLLSALRLGGLHAPMVIEGATTMLVFEAYVEQVLAPILKPDDVVILDNLAAHKSDKTRCLVEAQSARLLFLPAYSPDLSPIEHAFSKLKQALRRAKSHTFDALLQAIAYALTQVT